MTNLIYLIISMAIVVFMQILLVSRKSKNVLFKEFACLYLCLTIHIFGLILQLIFKDSGVPLIYFDYISYLGVFFTPVCFFCIALTYRNSNVNIKKIIYFLIIIPIISLITLWTNDLHHLFVKNYSTNISEVIYGPIFYVYSIYSYLLIFTAMIIFVMTSKEKSGFLSVHTFLMILGGLVPITVNILGTLKIIDLTIYITPILFIISSVCYYIAIFKLNALNIIPVASRTVMDTMSDAYVVISNDGTIADSNKTFKEKFKSVLELDNKNSNLFEIFEKSKLIDLKDLNKHIEETREKKTSIVEEYHFKNDDLDQYFEVDIHPISARYDIKEYIATLMVFKDITQHKNDIKQIEEKQEIIVKQQQLVSIGELAGGVAHDINTPISAIKTGIVMLNTMGGKRTEAEKEILERMDNCATKIINIVNSMRNQIRNLGGTTKVKFKVSGVLNDIKIITYHEIKKNNSEVCIDIKDDVCIMGDPTKFGQVLTNLVVNAAQAYNEKGGKINVIVSKLANKYALINVIDYAGGMDESVVPYVFKNILTTKGIAGTGLGLYLSYSVIKGEFNGNIDFNTKKNEGTTFSIKIPLAE